MKRGLIFTIFLFYSLLVLANEDSLIVYSLLEQASATENVDSATIYADKAMNYSRKNKYLDGVLTTAKHFGNLYAKTGELVKSINLYL